jgi:hypothetical protein
MNSRETERYLDTLLDYQFDILWRRAWGEGHTEFLFSHAIEIMRHEPCHSQRRKSSPTI